MATFLKPIIFFILSVLLLTSNFAYGKIHVRIYNALSVNSDLNIHCKSKDDDLGVHLIHLFDYFEFSFNKRVFRETLFFFVTFGGRELLRGLIYTKKKGIIMLRIYAIGILRKINCVCLWVLVCLRFVIHVTRIANMHLYYLIKLNA